MKTTIATFSLLILLALPALSQTTPAPATPAPSSTAAPAAQGAVKPAEHPAIPEQLTIDDLQKAFIDLSTQMADASKDFALKKAAFQRQIDAWKKRAESAEAALEEAKKSIPAGTPGAAGAAAPLNAKKKE